jgi:DMSO/TMAO reductase YedYZ heme-binding membrane subunit
MYRFSLSVALCLAFRHALLGIKISNQSCFIYYLLLISVLPCREHEHLNQNVCAILTCLCSLAWQIHTEVQIS